MFVLFNLNNFVASLLENVMTVESLTGKELPVGPIIEFGITSIATEAP